MAYCEGLALRSFEPNSVLLREGDRGGELLVLIDGEVEVLRGAIEVAVVNEPGAIFGEMSALLNAPYSATVRARSLVRAYIVDDADQFLRSHPEITYYTARLLARRLRDATTYLADVKQQFQDQSSHLAMVDQILESLMHQQGEDITPGSDLEQDPRL